MQICATEQCQCLSLAESLVNFGAHSLDEWRGKFVDVHRCAGLADGCQTRCRITTWWRRKLQRHQHLVIVGWRYCQPLPCVIRLLEWEAQHWITLELNYTESTVTKIILHEREFISIWKERKLIKGTPSGVLSLWPNVTLSYLYLSGETWDWRMSHHF